MKRTLQLGIAAALVLTVFTLCGWAQPKPMLVEPPPIENYIPSDAMLYVYYEGLTKASATFHQTAMEQILAEPEVQTFGAEISRFMDELMKQKMADAPIGWADVRTLLDSELAFGLMDVRGQVPSMALIVRAGAGKDNVQALVDRLIAKVLPPGQQVPENDMDGTAYKQVGPFCVAWVQDDLVITSGSETLRKVLRAADGRDNSMVKNDRFQAACKKTLGGKEFLMAHFNMERSWAVIAEKNNHDPEFQKMLTATGLKDVNYVHLSVAPDAPGIKLTLYAHAPQGAKGLFKLFPTKPVDEKSMLAGVSDSASDFCIARCSAADLFDAVADISQVDGEGDFKGGVDDINRKIGFDLRKDLLSSLGDEVTVRSIGPGMGLLPELYASTSVKDEKAVRACIDKLAAVLKDAAEKDADAGVAPAGIGPMVPAGPRLVAEKIDYRGTSVVAFKFTGMPMFFSPSVAVAKGRLYIALTPQTVKKALDLPASVPRPIVSSAPYLALRSHVTAKPSLLVYSEFREGFDALYSGGLAYVVQVLNGVPPGEIPANNLATLLPSANAITPHLFGTLAAFSNDGEGYLIESYGPLGGGPTLGGPGVASIGIVTGFTLPALGHAQESARRASCMNNVRQIGLSMLQYAGDHDDKFPPDFGTLLKEGYLTTPKVFFCPSDRKAYRLPDGWPEDLKNADVAELNKMLDGFTSYVMVKGINHAVDADIVVVYDKDGAHGRQGRNCFFNDGHVKWYSEVEFQRLMQSQNRRLKAEE